MNIGTIRRAELQPISAGSVSSGTHLTEDLLRAFSDELGRIYAGHWREDVDEARAYLNNRDLWRDQFFSQYPQNTSEDEAASMLLEGLIEGLEEAAPEHLYFGAHPGDGADFGFWPHEGD